MRKTELDSFVLKFHQLRRAGFNAHLDVHSEGSNAWVCLRVQLGEAGQQHQSWGKRGLRRSPAYARRQERRRAAREARRSAAEAEKQAEEMPAKEDSVPKVTLAAEEAEVVAPSPSVIVNSECRKVKSRDKWMKEDIGLIEAVIIDTVTSLENVYEDRFVRCRHCKRLSKDVVFYDHRCERQPGYHQFHEDVRVMLDPDQAEVAAICSL